MSKTVFRYDERAGSLRAPTRTPQGFLRADGHAARVGIYKYRRADGSYRYELRPPEEVFHPDSLASYDGAPITIGHPRGADGEVEDVTADNVRKYEVGTVSGAARRDGDLVATTSLIKDAAAIRRVEGGMRELSPGYRIRYDETPGFAPQYATPDNPTGRYHGVQRDIRVNHQAIVPEARGGKSIQLRMDDAELVLRDDAELDAKERHALPASDFAVPESEGMPIHDAEHVRAAMARFNQFDFKDSAQRKSAYRRILARAKKLDIDASGFEEAHRADSMACMTTAEKGHQHLVDPHDWNGCDRSCGDTSYAVSEGAANGQGHTHPWVRDMTTGKITIGESEGHTHGLLDDTPGAYGTNGAAPGQRGDSQFDRIAAGRDRGVTMTTTATPNSPPDPAEQVRLLTVRADEAARETVTQRERADAAEARADGLRAETVTLKERIKTLEAQIAAGASVVETAAVQEQRRRADNAERELSELRERQPAIVRKRAGLIAKCTAVVGSSLRADAMTEREMVIAAVRQLRPGEDVGAHVSDEYLEKRLDSLIQDRTDHAASLARASQTLAMRGDAAPSPTPINPGNKPAAWNDTWKRGAGQFATHRKD